MSAKEIAQNPTQIALRALIWCVMSNLARGFACIQVDCAVMQCFWSECFGTEIARRISGSAAIHWWGCFLTSYRLTPLDVILAVVNVRPPLLLNYEKIKNCGRR